MTERQTRVSGPTLDSDLYSYATSHAEDRARDEIRAALPVDRLARWFGAVVRDAYSAGLRDGYAQGVHERHNDEDGDV